VVFGPASRRLLTNSREARIRIRKTPLVGLTQSKQEYDLPYRPARNWDMETGKQLLALRAGEFTLSCASFSLDGRKVLTGSSASKLYAVYSDTGQGLESGSEWRSNKEETFARVYDAVSAKELLKLPH
jgi:hypothetical protein